MERNLYETLCTREEMSKAEDLGDFYRIPTDGRDLNYSKYFSEGEQKLATIDDYNSNNTRRLNLDETRELLMSLDYVQEELKSHKMKILVTGSTGFHCKKPACASCAVWKMLRLCGLDRNSDMAAWEKAVGQADVIFHLAGANRPPDPTSFKKDNTI